MRVDTKQVLFSADDFGMTVEVNEAVEQAYHLGLLGNASLMVTGAATQDAVTRARHMPKLNIGLHLVVIEGRSLLPKELIPDLIDTNMWFSSDQLRLGINYYFRPAVRRQLQKEINAQFKAFAATGLPFGHVNAHKHMHLHPTVGRMMLEQALLYGVRYVRVPYEPAACLQRIQSYSNPIRDRLLRLWTKYLREQVTNAGLKTTDYCFGLLNSGHMTSELLCNLIQYLPNGTSEIYFHPASKKNTDMELLMPNYEHEAELAALCSDTVKDLLRKCNVKNTSWEQMTQTP